MAINNFSRSENLQENNAGSTYALHFYVFVYDVRVRLDWYTLNSKKIELILKLLSVFYIHINTLIKFV